MKTNVVILQQSMRSGKGAAAHPNNGGVASSVLVAVRVRPFHRGEDAVSDAHLVQVGADGYTMHLAEAPSSNGAGTASSQSSPLTLAAAQQPSSVVRHSFSFDKIFASDVHRQLQHCASLSAAGDVGSPNDQQAVYEYLGPMLCQHTMQSYNSCLFAYGQTGSGKTYSMIGRLATAPPSLHQNTTTGAVTGLVSGDEDGIVPRLCEDLFRRMKAEREHNSAVTHRVECTFVEIYCERVRDLIGQASASPGGGSTPPSLPLGAPPPLLQPQPPHPHSLRVRQHPNRGPYVEGAQLVSVKDAADVMHLLQLGLRERATAETKMNDQSSRSHAILQLHVTRVEVARATASESSGGSAAAVVTKTRSSKVNLVDLAGSERVLQSGATSGDRFEEARNINLSLHSLGRVIQVLADRSAAVPHHLPSSAQSVATTPPQQVSCAAVPPYRESVLTWLLSDSLGGNSKTIMLATVAPSAACHSQTVSTLRFACIAKRVVNVASINEDAHFHRLVSELREQILRLSMQLEEAKQGHVGVSCALDDETPLDVARRAATEAEAVVCEQSATIHQLKAKVELLEHQVKDQHTQIQATNGLVEQCSRLRLELHSTQGDLALSKRRCTELEAEVHALKTKTSPATASAAGAWSREASPTSGLDLELLNAELQHQLEDATTQRNAANMRRERAEVGRIEANVALQKCLEELRTSDAARAALSQELNELRQQGSSSAVGSAPPVLRSMAKLQQGPTKQMDAAEEAQRREVEDAVQRAVRELNAKHDAEMKAMSLDVHDLEQLLLEETETSQRFLLLGAFEAQTSQLYRAFSRGFWKVKHADIVSKFALTARVVSAEALERADLIASSVVLFPSADVGGLWHWIDHAARLRSQHSREEEAHTLSVELEKWKRDAKAQMQEAALLHSSLQKLQRAREATESQLSFCESENAKLFRLLSDAQTSHEETKEELRAAEEALQAAEAAADMEEKKRRLDHALDEDIDGLKGTVDQLTSENRFVHATNSDMTSRYDSVIQKLRSERQRLLLELHEANATQDLRLRELQATHRQERDALEDERDQLIAELQELRSAMRRSSWHPSAQQTHENNNKATSPRDHVRVPLSQLVPNNEREGRL